ncbi:hypothetical protein WA026_020385 [Henosepilachna vigintioctopunctata]|uniref:Uncharacterized protein n=1 Tax=Henosepilachna vigintioctopunctata TaxID=420089 RepID=A0AAW1UP18_9CUCU
MYSVKLQKHNHGSLRPNMNLTLTNYAKITTNHQVLRKVYLDQKNKYPDFAQVYTDASRHTEGSAAVVYHEQIQHVFGIPTQCRIFTGEVAALRETLTKSHRIG